MTHDEAMERAPRMRADLSAAFPGVKFSVRIQKRSGRSIIRTEWTQGPSFSSVLSVTRQYGKKIRRLYPKILTEKDDILLGEKIEG